LGAPERFSRFLDSDRGAEMKRICCVLATIAVLVMLPNAALARSHTSKQLSRSKSLLLVYQTTIVNTFSLHDQMAPTLNFLRRHPPALALAQQDPIVGELLGSIATYPTQSQLSYLVQARDIRGLKTREVARINAAINSLLPTYQQQVTSDTLLTTIQ